MPDLHMPGDVLIDPPVFPRVTTAPPRPSTVTVLPVAGPPGDASSGHLGPPTLVGGEWAVPLTSNWGVTPAGAVYYDPAGAVPDEAAVASLDVDGHLTVTQPAGD